MNSGSVKKSVIIDADVEKVWSKVSKITKLDWLNDNWGNDRQDLDDKNAHLTDDSNARRNPNQEWEFSKIKDSDE